LKHGGSATFALYKTRVPAADLLSLLIQFSYPFQGGGNTTQTSWERNVPKEETQLVEQLVDDGGMQIPTSVASC
jgi:hypothetical protein